MFAEHYKRACGPGIILPVNKTKLKIAYGPASDGFAGTVFTSDCGGLPDVSAIGGPRKKLQAVVDSCTAELEKYSRYIGKYPDKRNDSEAILFLPIPHGQTRSSIA